MKKHLRVVLVALLVLICAYIALRGINFREFWNEFKKADYLWLIPSMAFVFISMVFRAFRWQCLLSPAKKIGFMDLFSAINICFMANNFLPARSGEFIRAVIIGKKHKTSISTVLATVVLERIFDAMCVVGLFLFLIFSFSLEEGYKKAGYVIAGVYILILVMLILMRMHPDFFHGMVHRLLRRFSSGLAHRICGFLDSFIQGLNVLREARQVALISMYSVFVWASIYFTYYFICYAFAIHMPVSGYVLLMCFFVIAVMMPIPGYVGSFHVAGKEALKIFGYSSSLALSCTTVAHGSQYIFINVLGLIFLRRENLSFKKLKEEEREAEEEYQKKV